MSNSRNRRVDTQLQRRRDAVCEGGQKEMNQGCRTTETDDPNVVVIVVSPGRVKL
jgi:hypothetical protein